MDISLKNLALGFIAGAIAVVTVHEIINYILHAMGLFSPRALVDGALGGHRRAADRERHVLGRSFGAYCSSCCSA